MAKRRFRVSPVPVVGTISGVISNRLRELTAVVESGRCGSLVS